LFISQNVVNYFISSDYQEALQYPSVGWINRLTGSIAKL